MRADQSAAAGIRNQSCCAWQMERLVKCLQRSGGYLTNTLFFDVGTNEGVSVLSVSGQSGQAKQAELYQNI